MRLAPWLVTRLVTASVTSPRAAPRRIFGVPAAASPAAIATHSFEWSAARVRRGMTVSSTLLSDSATAKKTRRSTVPSPMALKYAQSIVSKP
jgi:hypothetical protein